MRPSARFDVQIKINGTPPLRLQRIRLDAVDVSLVDMSQKLPFVQELKRLQYKSLLSNLPRKPLLNVLIRFKVPTDVARPIGRPPEHLAVLDDRLGAFTKVSWPHLIDVIQRDVLSNDLDPVRPKRPHLEPLPPILQEFTMPLRL